MCMTITSMRIDSDTKNRLLKLGKKGQSYDSIVNYLLDKNEDKKV